MAFYVAPISNGLGDLIVSIPILQALIKTDEPTYLIMRSPAQSGLSNRIEGLAGSIKESEFDESTLKPTDKYFNFRDHPLQSDYIWGSEEFEAKYPGYKINDVLIEICREWGIDVDFENLVTLPFKHRSESENRIVFVPGSAGLFKCWPIEHWIRLHDLFDKQGEEVVIVGQPERSADVRALIEYGAKHVPTPTLEDAVDVISSAMCSIAVDTGLMHMSVHQGVPTVAIFRYNTMFMRPYKNKRPLVAPVCPAVCREREFADAPNERLRFPVWQLWEPLTCALENQQEHCLYQITPEMVMGEVRAFMAERV